MDQPLTGVSIPMLLCTGAVMALFAAAAIGWIRAIVKPAAKKAQPTSARQPQTLVTFGSTGELVSGSAENFGQLPGQGNDKPDAQQQRQAALDQQHQERIQASEEQREQWKEDKDVADQMLKDFFDSAAQRRTDIEIDDDNSTPGLRNWLN